MILKNIEITNFRSIDNLKIDFSEHYTAISGQNNSGKSNVLRPIKILFGPKSRYRFYDEGEILFSRDLPSWIKSDHEPLKINFKFILKLFRDYDSSIFKLAEDYFKLDNNVSDVELTLSINYQKDKDLPEYQVCANVSQQPLDSYKSKKIFESIKTSGAFLFYNSTEPVNPFEESSHLAGLVGKLSKQEQQKVKEDRDKLSKTVSSLAKKHQTDVTELLGRLKEKYTIGFSATKLSLDYLPINVSLAVKDVNVALDDWGSGTKNRTNILLALFKAKKLQDSADEDTKIAPVIIIEEPESFLHASAQAEFGRVIQDLSQDFNVQVIVATHSPYFLSHKEPQSNVLLRRITDKGKLRETENVLLDSENWMQPFASVLGYSDAEFKPWKNLIFSGSRKFLLVEGEIDKCYFEMLRDDAHGEHKLNFDGEIYSYNGYTELNVAMLRIVKQFKVSVFVTFDLDVEDSVIKNLKTVGMVKSDDYFPIGINESGKKDIEGLLPETVTNHVRSQHYKDVNVAINGKIDERKLAKQKLKKLYLEQFKSEAKPGEEYYSEFYKITKIINKAMTKFL